MGTRRLNPRLPKIHRTYTVEEAARLLGVHRNTVRLWLKQGLPPIDDRRPILIRGSDLADFLRSRRARNRRPCAPGEIYCVRCRAAKKPAGNMADFQPLTASSGDLVGICPDCDCMIYRRASLASLDEAAGELDIKISKVQPRISDRPEPFVNCDLNQEGGDRAEVQPPKRAHEATILHLPQRGKAL